MYLKRLSLVTFLLLLNFTSPALAYIGPGAGLGAIGTILSLLGALVLLIVGFVWYPVKRLLKKRKPETDDTSAAVDQDE